MEENVKLEDVFEQTNEDLSEYLHDLSDMAWDDLHTEFKDI